MMNIESQISNPAIIEKAAAYYQAGKAFKITNGLEYFDLDFFPMQMAVYYHQSGEMFGPNLGERDFLNHIHLAANSRTSWVIEITTPRTKRLKSDLRKLEARYRESNRWYKPQNWKWLLIAGWQNFKQWLKGTD